MAVKVLKAYKEAWDDFCLEAKFVSSVEHKHIATLIGVCVEDDNLVLVYELFPRGSLEENLHGKQSPIYSFNIWPTSFYKIHGKQSPIYFI